MPSATLVTVLIEVQAVRQYVEQGLCVGYCGGATGRGAGLAGLAAAAADALHRHADRVGAAGHDAAAVGHRCRVAVSARPPAAAHADGDGNLAAIRRRDATAACSAAAADALDEHAGRPVAPCRHGTAVGQADDAGIAARAAAAANRDRGAESGLGIASRCAGITAAAGAAATADALGENAIGILAERRDRPFVRRR